MLGFIDRGSHTVLTAHPGKRLENNYSLNTVEICPVGALTTTDFRFKMRVWFLKETKSICTSCAHRLQHASSAPARMSFTARRRARTTPSTPAGCATTAG